MKQFDLQSVKQRFAIIGNSEALNRAIDIAVQVAPTDLSVLITGESGVGKENFPQIIHTYSYRKHGPYIAVNCGAIPEGTIDSELFGHEKGSFTGATADRKGYFEVADGGTIFLDEVAELPLSTQVRLLRVLEAGEFIKVGSSKTLKTDVRVVAATNTNVPQAIRDGRFREDLYYRLNSVPIYIPPLRERKADIPLLFRKFASDFSEKYNMPPIRLTEDGRALLLNYYWNGNVRQLKNITEQISVIEQQREITASILRSYLPNEQIEKLPAVFKSDKSEGKTFNSEREILYQVLFDMKKDMNDLKKVVNELMAEKHFKTHDTTSSYTPTIIHQPADVPVGSSSVINSDFLHHEKESKFEDVDDVELVHDVEDYKIEDEALSLADMEKQMIIRTLEKYRGRRKPAAEELKISERTLYRKIKEYEIEA
ncbi:MAG: sigma-54-dependent Fis family transcriptional regulator [Porphyromonadaceae bacterium]|nr:sigma-54-dependent Fis family transcriptional regulator [Porphyromonadaceae bacterium]